MAEPQYGASLQYNSPLCTTGAHGDCVLLLLGAPGPYAWHTGLAQRSRQSPEEFSPGLSAQENFQQNKPPNPPSLYLPCTWPVKSYADIASSGGPSIKTRGNHPSCPKSQLTDWGHRLSHWNVTHFKLQDNNHSVSKNGKFKPLMQKKIMKLWKQFWNPQNFWKCH